MPDRMADHALERALAVADSGITIADATRPDHPLSYVNASFERLTGYPASEAVGRNCRFLQGPDTDPEAVAALRAAIDEQREARVVLLNYRRDGSRFYNELRLAPVLDDAGRCIQVVGVQNDVTDLVRARSELKRHQSLVARQDEQIAELRVLQEALTPTDPASRPQLELASAFLPAEHGVAGDFHLVAAGPQDATVLVVGDVVGHGLDAARRATYVRASLATFAPFTDDPLRLLTMANQSLIERSGTSTEFVTAVCVSFRPRTGTVRWASAGHPPPLRLGSGEPLAGPAQASWPLGLELSIGGTVAEVPLGAGEGLLMYSDGLTEARGPGAPGFVAPRLGDQRVAELVGRLGGATPAEVVAALQDAARAHTGGSLADDLCLLALRVAAVRDGGSPPGAGRLAYTAGT